MNSFAKILGVVVLSVGSLPIPNSAAGNGAEAFEKLKIAGGPLGNGQNEHEQSHAGSGVDLRRHGGARKIPHGG